jgi:protein-L-isoaspartate(D-aspartate) O-methyltransferase
MRTMTITLLFFLAIGGIAFITQPAMRQTAKDTYAAARQAMIEKDLKGRDIRDPAVLKAMERVPRHRFVAASLQDEAYADYPLPIEEGQTISQPYIVAFMTQGLALSKTDRVLEIGTGSGYQAAVLAEVAGEVYSIEIKSALAKKAADLLLSLGYANIKVRAGDGFFGWQEHAPFDAIMVTCAVDTIPQPLIDQLKDGGRIILPVGSGLWGQSLLLGVKHGKNLDTRDILPVRFVPMTGKAQQK